MSTAGDAGPRNARGGVHRIEHLFALSAFALAQPLFSKLGPAPGFFAAHGVTSLELVLVALGLVVLPPLALALFEAVVGIASRRARWGVHVVFVGALLALVALPLLGGLPTALAYALAIAVGIGFAAAYVRSRGVRTFTSALVVGPILFLAVFLFAAPTSKLVLGTQRDAWKADDSFRPPIVFIQFDALPSLLLETPDRHVDSKRFPNFARLAREGTWYRNASNVHENTVFSVPSFIDGRLPRKGITPVVQDHYPNLFTLLGPTYRLNVAEEATALCPKELCRERNSKSGSLWDDTRVVVNQLFRPEDQRGSLPSIRHRWQNFDAGPLKADFTTRKKTPEFVIRHLHSGRIGRFNRWIDKVGGGGARPELDYIHMFLPHEPREFMPDGKRYVTPESALEGTPAYNSAFLSNQEEQRTILQMAYTDRVVGQVIDRLERLGVYDDALVVVVADHGESFRAKPTPAGGFVPGHLGYRRAVTQRNLADIASIPIFIKYPKGHGPSGIDDRFVRSVDVFPTIAATLGVALPPLSGRSLNDNGYRGHTDVRVATTYDGVVRSDTQSWQRERSRSLQSRLSLFGSGTRNLFAWGPHRALVGKAVADYAALPAGTLHATVDGAQRLANVDPGSSVCLCQLAGRLDGSNPVRVPLAIAVNGQIAATGEGFAPRGKKRLSWSAMIPADAYRPGHNRVAVYRISGDSLEPLGGTS